MARSGLGRSRERLGRATEASAIRRTRAPRHFGLGEAAGRPRSTVTLRTRRSRLPLSPLSSSSPSATPDSVQKSRLYAFHDPAPHELQLDSPSALPPPLCARPRARCVVDNRSIALAEPPKVRRAKREGHKPSLNKHSPPATLFLGPSLHRTHRTRSTRQPQLVTTRR